MPSQKAILDDPATRPFKPVSEFPPSKWIDLDSLVLGPVYSKSGVAFLLALLRDYKREEKGKGVPLPHLLAKPSNWVEETTLCSLGRSSAVSDFLTVNCVTRAFQLPVVTFAVGRAVGTTGCGCGSHCLRRCHVPDSQAQRQSHSNCEPLHRFFGFLTHS